MDAEDRFHRSLADEYSQITRIVSEFDGRAIVIKGWSVTLSLALIGLAFQQRHGALFALAAVTGACFWTIEALAKRHQVRYYPRMRQIEAWSAQTDSCLIDGQAASAPRIDAAWTAAGRSEPAKALRETPREMSDEDIMRSRRNTFWLPHVFLPSALAVALGVFLSLLAAAGIVDIPM